ncbi:MAG: hypothetical protein MJE68_16600 [Proteobacteria bacterium]|nr:hypothetical protein [Pseudomonadota bacterium]
MTVVLSNIIELRFPQISLYIFIVHIAGKLKSVHVVVLVVVKFGHVPQFFASMWYVSKGKDPDGGLQLNTNSEALAAMSCTSFGGRGTIIYYYDNMEIILL